MSGGVFAVARGIFDHEFFAKEPFTEREAWVWLIGEAAWRGRKARAGKIVVELSRGQCAFSIRFIAERWGWSKSRVARFLDRLKTEAMIGTATDHTISIITICKYNDYQKVSLPTGTQDGTAIGTEAGQSRDKLEDRENIQTIIKEEPLRGPAALPAKSIEAEVYAFGKKVLGKSAGGVISKLRKTCDYDDTHALSWLNQAAEKASPMEWLQAVLKASGNREYRGVEGVPVPAAPIIESKAERDYREWEDNYYRTVA
jgi:hypothetical protein